MIEANREAGVNITTYCLNFNYTQTIDKYLNIAREFKVKEELWGSC
jgi:hypothetical protein